jgi:tetratricopeptide (TPR) repeat protein
MTATEATFRLAAALHQQGRLTEAERAYQDVLRAQPNHFDSLHLSGLIALRTGRTQRGVQLIKQAIAVNSKVAAAHNNLGNGLRDLQRHKAALASYDKAIELRRDYAEAWYNRANVLRDLRRHDEAIASFREAVALKPDYADAWCNLGIALRDTGRVEEAVASYQAAIAARPDHAEAHGNLGNAQRELKRYEDAEASHDKAVALSPNSAGAWLNRAHALADLGRHDAAAKDYQQAVVLKSDAAEIWRDLGLTLRHIAPNSQASARYDQTMVANQKRADTWYLRGTALHELGFNDAADVCFDKAIALQSDHPRAWFGRAGIARDAKQFEQAAAAYAKAILFKPDFTEAYVNRSTALNELDRQDEALACCDRAIELRPDMPSAHNNRGNSLRELGRYDEAVVSFEQAIALKPDFVEAYTNLGNVSHLMMRQDAAIACYEKALALRPDWPEALSGLGVTYADLLRGHEALALFTRAIALKPNFPDAERNASFVSLQLGFFEQGWRLHEARKRLKHPVGTRPYPQPSWTGEQDLAGKTLFIHREQGLGDVIQFSRYAKLAHEKGARVIMEVQPPLEQLLRQSGSEITIVSPTETPRTFDFHCAIMSLPLAFGTTLETIPSGSRYLHADPAASARWEARLPPRTRPRVAVVWSGNPKHNNDHNRSIDLATFSAVFSNTVEWFCVQKDIRETDRAILKQIDGLHCLGDELDDFSDTAALLDVMDLVITVDTSVAHLAGAMGKPTWLLLPYNPDWRWLLDRDDSPWYPSFRLFRQTQAQYWAPVLQRVKRELETLASAA